MKQPYLLSIALGLCLCGYSSFCYSQQDDEEEPLHTRPNPEERGVLTATPVEMRAGEIVPGDDGRIQESAVEQGKSNLLSPASTRSFNPRPEPPARVLESLDIVAYKLEGGQMLEIRHTSRGKEAYILQRVRPTDGGYRLKGGTDISVKNGIVLGNHPALGTKGPAATGTEKMGIVLEDKKR